MLPVTATAPDINIADRERTRLVTRRTSHYLKVSIIRAKSLLNLCGGIGCHFHGRV